MLLRSLFVVSALSSSFLSTSVLSQVVDPNGPVGSCAYTPVYLNDLTLTLTPDSSSTAIDILPDFTPAYDGANIWRYTVERGDDLPSGVVTFTPTSLTDYATFRIRINHGDYVFAQEGEAVTFPFVAGTDLIEYDVIQAPCAGTDIQEYSITLYQNGTSIIPVTPPAAPGLPGQDQAPTAPEATPVEAESSTAVAAPPAPPAAAPCAFSGPVYLNSFSLFLTPTGSNSQIDFGPYITPTYSPEGPEWRYVIERGADFPTGTIAFTPLDLTAGSTFRIRFNHGDYTTLTAGEVVDASLLADSNLIEFDVIQAPCAGSDIQEYSITLYQNGTSKIPQTAPVVLPPTSSPVVIPTLPPVQTLPPTTSAPSMPMMGAPVECQAVTFSQGVVAASDLSSVEIQFNNTATDRSVSWVDFHVSINANLVAGSPSTSAPQFNYRMKQAGDENSFSLTFPSGLDDVTLSGLSYINYFFTYCSESTDCNTDVYNFATTPAAPVVPVTPSAPLADNITSAMPTSTPSSVSCSDIDFIQYTSIEGAANETDSETFSFSWYTISDVMIGWVDIHVTIASSTVNGQFNYRMFSSPVPADSTSQFTSGAIPTDVYFITMPGVDGVTIPNDATVTYFFTYCAENVDCNSQNFNFNRNPENGGAVVGSPSASSSMVGGVCPAVTYVPSFERDADNANILTVNFTVTSMDSMVEWVDLHVTINTALLSDGMGAYSPSYNYRMNQFNATVFTYTFPGIDGVSIPSTSYLDYFFTYCAMDSATNTKTDCNTEPGTFGASQAIGTIVTENKLDTTQTQGAGGVNVTNTDTTGSTTRLSPGNGAAGKSVATALIMTVAAAVMAVLL